MHITTSTLYKILKMHATVGRRLLNEAVDNIPRPHEEGPDIYCTYSLGNGFISQVRREYLVILNRLNHGPDYLWVLRCAYGRWIVLQFRSGNKQLHGLHCRSRIDSKLIRFGGLKISFKKLTNLVAVKY